MIRLVRKLLALTLLTSLTACGGGVAVGLDLGYAGVVYQDVDAYPSVSLATSTSVARTGDVVRLVAAATDDHRVDLVEFYVANAQGNFFPLAALRSPPYVLDTVVADGSGGVVYFMARAIDDYGQYTDSALVPVRVVP